MTRRCSHCGNNGHNSRTCPNRGVKIFGVRLDGGGSIRKSQSMGNLSHYAGGTGGGSPGIGGEGGDDREKDGYASDGFEKGSSSSCRDRKKGVAWTEEEHKMFLLGLQNLGKGDWRGISRNFVVSRTATQVASHAQKYFIRQMNANKRKRRTSLFDMVPDELEAQSFPVDSQDQEAHNSSPAPLPSSSKAEHESKLSNSSNPSNPVPAPLLPTLPVSFQPFPVDMEKSIPKPGAMQYPCAVICPPYPPYFPFSYPFWPCYTADATASNMQSLVRPAAQHSASPINMDQIVGMSKLSIGEAAGQMSSPSMSPSLLGSSERHSAFHATASASGSRMDSTSNPIHAV